MRRWLAALRFDVTLQARQGFYAATAVIVVVIGGLLLSIPAQARGDAALVVPFLVVVNLPITTFFFMCGLILLERDEGTLLALAVTPATPAAYLAVRAVTLSLLAAIETLVVAGLAYAIESPLTLAVAALFLGVILTGFGAGVSARYATINELILPGSVFITFLLLPLLPHFGLMARAPLLIHPVEPALTLLRSAYSHTAPGEWAFGVAGSVMWCVVAWEWGRRSLSRLMVNTAATGGR